MGFNFAVEKAVREKIYVKLALMSPSGGGKSYSALRVATGMKSEMEKILKRKVKILLGNTEGARGRYYANEFDYDIVDLSAPFSPEMYVAFVDYAVTSAYDILIIDGTSPEWEGTGGCLELQQTAGGKYQDWGKVTPRHNKFIHAIADSPIHIIATMRGKDQYEVEKDDRGKTSVKKLGVGAKQREGFEYEFTSTFLIDQKTHLAESQKDNTHIFENDPNSLLTEDHGEKIIQWANSGEGYTPPVRDGADDTTNINELKEAITNIDSLAHQLSDNGVDSKAIADAVKVHNEINGRKNANYNSIKDIDIAKKVLEELKTLIKDESKGE